MLIATSAAHTETLCKKGHEMSDNHDAELVKTLLERAVSYRNGGGSAEHTAVLLERAAGEIERLGNVCSTLRTAIHSIDRTVRNPDVINALLKQR